MMRYICIILIFLFANSLFPNSEYNELLYIQEKFNCDYEKAKELRYIKEAFDCTYKEAAKIDFRINHLVDKIQINLSTLASGNESYSEKKVYRDSLLNCFYSSSSLVQVSNLNKDIKEYNIKEYLEHLSKLKEEYGYTKVNLEFLPNYLGLGKFRFINDGEYELAVSMKQKFEGYIDNNCVYSDISTKKFRFVFICNKSMDKVTLKADEILVTETLKKYKE